MTKSCLRTHIVTSCLADEVGQPSSQDERLGGHSGFAHARVSMGFQELFTDPLLWNVELLYHFLSSVVTRLALGRNTGISSTELCRYLPGLHSWESVNAVSWENSVSCLHSLPQLSLSFSVVSLLLIFSLPLCCWDAK